MADPRAVPAAKVTTFRSLILDAATRHGVEPTLVMAVIHEESGGDPDAFRIEPAVRDASFGLMQLLLGTARGLGWSLPPRYLFDPTPNIELGTQLLALNIHQYGSAWLALIAYNGGGGAVRWYRAGWKTGPAVHYANVVWALKAYYGEREADLARSLVHDR